MKIKNKRCLRPVSLALALCMGLPCLAACGGVGGGTDAPDTTVPEPADTRGVIIADGKANYHLRADRLVKTASSGEIDMMNDLFFSLTGARLEYSDTAEPYIELKFDGERRDYSVDFDPES